MSEQQPSIDNAIGNWVHEIVHGAKTLVKEAGRLAIAMATGIVLAIAYQLAEAMHSIFFLDGPKMGAK